MGQFERQKYSDKRIFCTRAKGQAIDTEFHLLLETRWNEIDAVFVSKYLCTWIVQDWQLVFNPLNHLRILNLLLDFETKSNKLTMEEARYHQIWNSIELRSDRFQRRKKERRNHFDSQSETAIYNDRFR